MNIIETTFEKLPTKFLLIGFEGENLRATVRIDCSSVFAEYPNATPTLIVKPLFADAYPVVVDRNGTDVDWLITSEILSFTGYGEIQLVFYKDEVICKSAITKIRVCRSLTVTGDMPDPVVQWIDRANAKLAEVDAQIVELEGMVDTATDAAERAEQSASTASAKAEQAAGSAATATEKATEATNAAGTATAKAAEAEQSALTATDKATAAAESERIATAKAVDATTAAGTATAKAGQATEAAQTATEKAGDASASATAAQASATNAASSATAAQASQTAARASETAAGASATQAAQSAQNASTASQTATQKAADASASATDAATSATNAATSAETASTKAGEAAQSAQAVAETAEQLADSLEQIEQNTQDIAELDERKANIDGYYPDMTVGNAEQLNSSKFVENSEPYTLRTSGGSSDIGNREYLDAVVGGTVAWNQAVRDEASENSTDFADVVTVTDAVEDAAGVKVKIEPVQDLHGYDHPWPAGGGKNLLPISEIPNTGATTIYDFGADTTFETITLSFYCNAAVFSNTSGAFVYFRKSNDSNAVVKTAMSMTKVDGSTIAVDTPYTGRVYTTLTNVEFKYIYVWGGILRSGTFTNPQLELNTLTDYAPYSNICPITGGDGVQVWDDPKYGGLIEWNQRIEYAQNDGWTSATTSDFFEDIDTRTVSATMTVASSRVKKQSMPTVKNHVYCLSAQITVSVNNEVRVELSRGWAQAPFSLSANRETLCQTVLTPTAENDNYEWVQFYVSNIGTYPCTLQVRDAMLLDLTEMFGAGNEPTTVEEFRAIFPADYYPYNAGEITTVSAVNDDPYRHYSITLPTEAGTVYGGTLDVSTGELVVDRAKVVFDGSQTVGSPNWRANEESVGWLYAKNITPGAVDAQTTAQNLDDIKCDRLEVVAYGSGLYTGTKPSIAWVSANWGLGMRVNNTSLTTAAAINAWLAENPVTVVYKLAEPISYTLTPTEIRTLLGQNNIWSDAGQTALTYTGTDEHLTLESGKKYLTRISGTDSMLLGSGQEITAAKGTDNVFDLTQMFGTAVADYVYGQGAAFFRKWFPNAVYPYNAGELKHVEGLQSHDTVGFNLWDEEARAGYYDTVGDWHPNASGTQIGSKNYIDVVGGATYYFHCGKSGTGIYRACWYDASKQFISTDVAVNGRTKTAPVNARYLMFSTSNAYGNTYTNDICINLSHSGARNGEYAPYEKHSYPLDSSVTLRGIPKVGANGVYWDGDRYLPDGTVERRYGVVDLGTLIWTKLNVGTDAERFVTSGISSLYKNPTTSQSTIQGNLVCSNYYEEPWTALNTQNSGKFMCVNAYNNSNIFAIRDISYTGLTANEFKSAMSGVLLIYELAEPTTETAQPYHSTQWVSDWGTEEFVSTGLVPVGHETRYPANLRDKLQHLPDAASGNGSYLITQTDGQMVLTPFPAPPSTAGNYVLKATVTGGVATYTWEVAT